MSFVHSMSTFLQLSIFLVEERSPDVVKDFLDHTPDNDHGSVHSMVFVKYTSFVNPYVRLWVQGQGVWYFLVSEVMVTDRFLYSSVKDPLLMFVFTVELVNRRHQT